MKDQHTSMYYWLNIFHLMRKLFSIIPCIYMSNKNKKIFIVFTIIVNLNLEIKLITKIKRLKYTEI